jgi:hypothetical protein
MITINASWFETDLDLQRAIEGLCGTVYSPSKRAWEEYTTLTGFGMADKKEGYVANSLKTLSQGEVLSVINRTYALYCLEPEDSLMVRAALFGAVATKVENSPKENLYMHWRYVPTTKSNHDFDTVETHYQTIMRLGIFYKPHQDSFKEAVAF